MSKQESLTNTIIIDSGDLGQACIALENAGIDYEIEGDRV